MGEMSEIESDQTARWNRFLAATIGFLVFESFLIGVFGEYYFTGVSSELGVWLMVALAASGYLMFGAVSGSWLSVGVIWIPILIALALDMPVPQDAWGSERLPLYGMWIYMSIIFLPAWFIGVVIGTYARR